jgi:CBS domain-containing protein
MGDSVGHVMPSQVLTTSPQSNIGEIDRIMDGQNIQGMPVDERRNSSASYRGLIY